MTVSGRHRAAPTIPLLPSLNTSSLPVPIQPPPHPPRSSWDRDHAETGLSRRDLRRWRRSEARSAFGTTFGIWCASIGAFALAAATLWVLVRAALS